jgi:hypothetical protein
MTAKVPLKLVTVNNAPERARRVVGRVIDETKESYSIVHAANAESKYSKTTILLTASELLQ